MYASANDKSIIIVRVTLYNIIVKYPSHEAEDYWHLVEDSRHGMMKTMQLSVILPCYNEEANIRATLEEVLAWAKGVEGG